LCVWRTSTWGWETWECYRGWSFEWWERTSEDALGRAAHGLSRALAVNAASDQCCAPK
jgi:hypothetical protein